ncbi:TIGR03032 family protein [Paraconexibacter algicola]|uniref:TIGR03032 family protein n=1 Tax=Paraconexibacter algicola TaxID=2133960 RepID=A0A2T4ULM6_9ACTN|nr:TIGR03032 family protein [Paraconexibacter algicola]PTL60105.1 TIGR03032 family protein [Paraconexibacter algicola]
MALHAVFLVGAGAPRLLAALRRGRSVWTADLAGHGGSDPQVRERFAAALRDREGRPPDAHAAGLALATAPAALVPALASAFPGARFVLLDGLRDDLAPARQVAVDGEALLARPRAVLIELCAWLGTDYDQALLGPLEQAAREVRAGQPLASGATDSVPETLARLGGSLLVSTYQAGKLVCARAQPDGTLNTHFRDHDKPMGLALGPDGRLALGTRTEVWDYRDVPDAAAKLEPPDVHDACFVLRNRHVTGDVAIHEMGFAGDELWIVATGFSCLATLDADHSFVPRWHPSWITELAPGDRCHLNGLEIVDGVPRYVTALGTGDTPGSWRAGKATGGVLLDVPSGEVVASGLSMPHSPRWHDGELLVLESGRGHLSRVDPATGETTCVAELPGFTRGLALVGRTAFVGLSQIRESSTFGDLPLTQRLRERQCGVWMVDLDSGETTGLLRFADLVQEVFDVLWLPDRRFPEIAEVGSVSTSDTYVLKAGGLR